MYTRRTFLKISGILATLLAGGYVFRNSNSLEVKHILSSVSHEKLAVTLSLSKGTSSLELILNNIIKHKKSFFFHAITWCWFD